MSEKINTTEKSYSYLKTCARLIKELKPIAWALVPAWLVAALSVLLSVIAPKIVGDITDILYGYGEIGFIDFDLFKEKLLYLAIVYTLTAACAMLSSIIMNNITSRYFTYTLRVKISEKLKYVPVKYVDGTTNGELMSRMMNDVSAMSSTVHIVIETLFSGFFKLIAISWILFTINPYMAGAVIVFIPLSIILSVLISAKNERQWHDFRTINGKVYSFIEEDFTGFDTVKAFNLADSQNKKGEELLTEYGKKVEKSWFTAGLVQPIIAFTDNIAYVLVCILGGYLVINSNGAFKVGDVVEVILYAKLLAGPLESIAGGMGSIHHTIACATRVYQLLDGEEMSQENTDEEPCGNGKIVFENVNFSYSPDKPLIKNLNLTVESGKKVAIVGPTGGGKTTIVNLLMRFYEIDSGKITIDGVDISKMDRAKLRSLFGMVLQDTWLFSGTVYENIAYGKECASEEEVMAAAKSAYIDRFIDLLPNGYQTVINEESTNISSGQKQLLTIARAYLSNRKMLILDEATSNVDTRTELLIQKTMDRLLEGRTSFVIAHRLSTIVNADVILVIDKGEVVEQGTHRELMAKNGFYTSIYNSQYELLK